MRFLFLAVFLLSCQSVRTSPVEQRLTEREVTYEKGSALFDNLKYAEAAPFFLKISQNSLGPKDELYNQALWKLSLIYDKIGEYERSILALIELEDRSSFKVSRLGIHLSLIKNYILVGNKPLATQIRTKLSTNIPVSEVYLALADTSRFNYDLLIFEELQFLSEIQRYFILVMESDAAPMNENATLSLIAIYDTFYSALGKDSLNLEFRKSIAIEMLDQLRKFDLYKLNEANLNPRTISKFSVFSTEKKKLITEWLHR